MDLCLWLLLGTFSARSRGGAEVRRCYAPAVTRKLGTFSALTINIFILSLSFLFLLVSFPSDTGHAPSLQKYKRTAFVQKCNFWGATRHKTFLGTVETRRAACRQQISTNKGGIHFGSKQKTCCLPHQKKRERIVFAALKVPNFLVTAGVQHLRTINSTPSAVGAESALHKGVNACTGKWISVFGCC